MTVDASALRELDARQPTAQTVFLVSGGAKGITAECVVGLARRYGSRFVLIGRSDYVPDGLPDWATGIDEEAGLRRAAMAFLAQSGEQVTPRRVGSLVAHVTSQREIQHTLESVVAAGGQAIYVSADVTDMAALQAAVEQGSQRLGPISGIIHGAGQLADKLIQHKTLEDFERVVSVKVDGLENLLTCVPYGQLAYLVLFSSVAGFYGNAGQSDYAVANEILNKVAHWVKARHPSCRVLALDWGPWDGGMVTPELRKQLVAHQVPLIPVREGVQILADLLTKPTPSGAVATVPLGYASARADVDLDSTQLVVGSSMPVMLSGGVEGRRVYRLWRRLVLDDNPFLVDHVIGGRAVLPTVCAVAWMINACEQLHPGYAFARIEGYRVLKGIVFDDDQPGDYLLELTVEGDERKGELVCDALISSRPASAPQRYHYRGRVTVRRRIADAAPVLELPSVETPVLEGATLYRDGTLFHGPTFQGIESILRLDEGGLVLRCCLPKLSLQDQGQFPVQTFNPYIADVQLQSLLVWSRHFNGYGGLPLCIQDAVQYRPARFDESTYVSMAVRSRSSRSLVADVRVQNEEGEVCLMVRGAEITLSERLNELFAQKTLGAGVDG